MSPRDALLNKTDLYSTSIRFISIAQNWLYLFGITFMASNFLEVIVNVRQAYNKTTYTSGFKMPISSTFAIISLNDTKTYGICYLHTKPMQRTCSSTQETPQQWVYASPYICAAQKILENLSGLMTMLLGRTGDAAMLTGTVLEWWR